MSDLRFTDSNSFFPKGTWAFNLPSGFTCPGALLCLRYANRETGKQTQGKEAKFQCYSAHVERWPSIRKIVWGNFDALKNMNIDQMVIALHEALPKKAKRVRVHAHGDFFSQTYFDAWMLVALRNPDVKFWAFTKSIPFWIRRKSDIPSNFCLTASMGGKYDDLAKEHKFKTAYMVNSVEEAQALGLKVDYDDTLASEGSEDFALICWSPFRASRKERFEAAKETGNEQANDNPDYDTHPHWPGEQRKRTK